MESAFGVDHGDVSKALKPLKMPKLGAKKKRAFSNAPTTPSQPWETLGGQGPAAAAARRNGAAVTKPRALRPHQAQVGMSTPSARKRNLGPSNTGVKRSWEI